MSANGLDTPWGLNDLEALAKTTGPNLRVVLPKGTFQAAQEIQGREYAGEWLLMDVAFGPCSICLWRTRLSQRHWGFRNARRAGTYRAAKPPCDCFAGLGLTRTYRCRIPGNYRPKGY